MLFKKLLLILSAVVLPRTVHGMVKKAPKTNQEEKFAKSSTCNSNVARQTGSCCDFIRLGLQAVLFSTGAYRRRPPVWDKPKTD